MTEYGLWSNSSANYVETGFPTIEKAAQALTDYVWLNEDNASDLEIVVSSDWLPGRLWTASESDTSVPCVMCGAEAGTPCRTSECGTYDLPAGGEGR